MKYIERINNKYSTWDRKSNILRINESYINQIKKLIFPKWFEAERERDYYKEKCKKLKMAKKIIHLDNLSDKIINIKTDGIAYFEIENSDLYNCNFNIVLNKKIPNKYSLLTCDGNNVIFSSCSFINDNGLKSK